MKIWVLIPAYNEAKRITSVVSAVKAKGFPVLVIDDGSQDATYDLAAQVADKVIKNITNLGKGKALAAGIDYLFNNTDFDHVVFMDADGQHSAGDLDKFKAQAEKGVLFAIGDRMNDPSGMPLIRVVTNKFMSWLISSLVGQKIKDTQCGFRMVKKDVLKAINIETDKFEVESEIIIKACRNKVAIVSVPIKSIYFTNPQSKIHPVKDTVRFIKLMLRLRSA